MVGGLNKQKSTTVKFGAVSVDQWHEVLKLAFGVNLLHFRGGSLIAFHHPI